MWPQQLIALIPGQWAWLACMYIESQCVRGLYQRGVFYLFCRGDEHTLTCRHCAPVAPGTVSTGTASTARAIYHVIPRRHYSDLQCCAGWRRRGASGIGERSTRQVRAPPWLCYDIVVDNVSACIDNVSACIVNDIKRQGSPSAGPCPLYRSFECCSVGDTAQIQLQFVTMPHSVYINCEPI